MRMLVLHLVGCVALLSGESFRAPAPTVEFAPSARCCPAPLPGTGPGSGPDAYRAGG